MNRTKQYLDYLNTILTIRGTEKEEILAGLANALEKLDALGIDEVDDILGDLH